LLKEESSAYQLPVGEGPVASTTKVENITPNHNISSQQQQQIYRSSSRSIADAEDALPIGIFQEGAGASVPAAQT
jgi:hypothetical protein